MWCKGKSEAKRKGGRMEGREKDRKRKLGKREEKTIQEWKE